VISMKPDPPADKSKGQEKSSGPSNRFFRLIALVESGTLVALLAAMILLAAGQILLRNFFNIGLSWGDQTLRVLVLWVGMMGAVVASRDNKHLNIDAFSHLLSERVRTGGQAVIGLFTALVCGVISYQSGRFVYLDYEAGISAFGGVPAWVFELILPIGFCFITLRYLLYSFTHFSLFRSHGGRK